MAAPIPPRPGNFCGREWPVRRENLERRGCTAIWHRQTAERARSIFILSRTAKRCRPPPCGVSTRRTAQRARDPHRTTPAILDEVVWKRASKGAIERRALLSRFFLFPATGSSLPTQWRRPLAPRVRRFRTRLSSCNRIPPVCLTVL